MNQNLNLNWSISHEKSTICCRTSTGCTIKPQIFRIKQTRILPPWPPLRSHYPVFMLSWLFSTDSPSDKMSNFSPHDLHFTWFMLVGSGKTLSLYGSLLSHDCWKVDFPGMTNFNYANVHPLLRKSKCKSSMWGIANKQQASVRLRRKTQDGEQKPDSIGLYHGMGWTEVPASNVALY